MSYCRYRLRGVSDPGRDLRDRAIELGFGRGVIETNKKMLIVRTTHGFILGDTRPKIPFFQCGPLLRTAEEITMDLMRGQGIQFASNFDEPPIRLADWITFNGTIHIAIRSQYFVRFPGIVADGGKFRNGAIQSHVITWTWLDCDLAVGSAGNANVHASFACVFATTQPERIARLATLHGIRQAPGAIFGPLVCVPTVGRNIVVVAKLHFPRLILSWHKFAPPLERNELESTAVVLVWKSTFPIPVRHLVRLLLG